MDTTVSPTNAVIDRNEWRDARLRLLELEKEETRLRDKVRAARRALPWVKVAKDYAFDTRTGRKTLAELFENRSQLLVYHFMLGPDWEEGCIGCSFFCDHIEGALPHLNNHDVTWIAVSRAPLSKIEAYRHRMGWNFPWVSSFGSEFNYDYDVSFSAQERASGSVEYNYRNVPTDQIADEEHGMSSFYRDAEGEIFHTYSTYARGGEEVCGTLMLLDRAPLGRNETSTMSFLKRHDEYGQKPDKAHTSCCH
ncbi:thioredoxin family protein [Neorhizobium sp. JUb45]|uniref:DUF899 domain-containing protein n=1 Tax=unclassified Neorhizobium TaxID=2629175 RepID=UPI00104AFEA3|nr:thioredoxin family protein [Neorhizobium sp. JUb45]